MITGYNLQEKNLMSAHARKPAVRKHPLVGAGLHRKDADGCVQNQAEDMNDHYHRVDEHRNKCIRERLESEKEGYVKEPSLLNVFSLSDLLGVDHSDDDDREDDE
jgi:hypothetical protein